MATRGSRLQPMIVCIRSVGSGAAPLGSLMMPLRGAKGAVPGGRRMKTVIGMTHRLIGEMDGRLASGITCLRTSPLATVASEQAVLEQRAR